MEHPENSRSQPSLDEIVTRSAAAIADQIRRAAALAKSEMDLQIDVATALKKFAANAKITLEGHHNVTVATGRPDSVYGSVIVEYKEPGKLSPNKDAAPLAKGRIGQRTSRNENLKCRPWKSALAFLCPE